MLTFLFLCLSLLALVATLFLLALGGILSETVRGQNPLGKTIQGVLVSIDALAIHERFGGGQRRVDLLGAQVEHHRAARRLALAQAEILELQLDRIYDPDEPIDDDDEDDNDDDEDDKDDDEVFAISPRPQSNGQPRVEPVQAFRPVLKDSILVRGPNDGVIQ